jgi:DEAD/DEAH box helicase
MTLSELQRWITSPDGMLAEMTLLSRYAAAKSVGVNRFSPEIESLSPNWPRLLLAGSILTSSDQPSDIEAALMIAHAGLLVAGGGKIADASATLLAQLANHRAIDLAKLRGIIPFDMETRLGALERMLATRRELKQSVFLPVGEPIMTNQFQQQLWEKLQHGRWVSASGPTASGKTYLVLRWLLNEFFVGGPRLAIFLAPTRALVGEIENELLTLCSIHQTYDIRIASLPLTELADRTRPTILVFTQERLHVFLNSVGTIPSIDIVVVDEAHKLGDSLRGVILQDAIERVARANTQARFVFLSPLTENPETVLSDAPSDAVKVALPNETVALNDFLAEDSLTEEQMLQRLSTGQWRLYTLPAAVKREIEGVITRRGGAAA